MSSSSNPRLSVDSNIQRALDLADVLAPRGKVFFLNFEEREEIARNAFPVTMLRGFEDLFIFVLTLFVDVYTYRIIYDSVKQ